MQDIKLTNKITLEFKQVSKRNIFDRIFNRFDGFVFYQDKNEDMKILKVKNLKNLYERNKELYNVKNKFGNYKGKPFILVKYPNAMTIDYIENSDKLYYDVESYYNYVNMATKRNLLKMGSDFNLTDFLKKNFFMIVILVAIALLFFTPQGKEMLAKFINGMGG